MYLFSNIIYKYLSGGYLGLLLGYSVLHLTKLVNPLLSLATSCYTAACSVCTLDTGDSVHSLKQ